MANGRFKVTPDSIAFALAHETHELTLANAKLAELTKTLFSGEAIVKSDEITLREWVKMRQWFRDTDVVDLNNYRKLREDIKLMEEAIAFQVNKNHQTRDALKKAQIQVQIRSQGIKELQRRLESSRRGRLYYFPGCEPEEAK